MYRKKEREKEESSLGPFLVFFAFQPPSKVPIIWTGWFLFYSYWFLVDTGSIERQRVVGLLCPCILHRCILDGWSIDFTCSGFRCTLLAISRVSFSFSWSFCFSFCFFGTLATPLRPDWQVSNHVSHLGLAESLWPFAANDLVHNNRTRRGVARAPPPNLGRNQQGSIQVGHTLNQKREYISRRTTHPNPPISLHSFPPLSFFLFHESKNENRLFPTFFFYRDCPSVCV